MIMLTGIELLQKVHDVQKEVKCLKIGDIAFGELVDDEIIVLRECGYTDEDKEGKEVVHKSEFLKAYEKAKEKQYHLGELTIIHCLIDHIDSGTKAAKLIMEDTDRSYQIALNESNQKLKTGDIKGAIKVFSMALFSHPNHYLCSRFYEQRAIVRYKTESINAARDFFFAGHIEIAWAKTYLEKGRSEDAILHLNKAVELGNNEAVELLKNIENAKSVYSYFKSILNLQENLPKKLSEMRYRLNCL